MGYDLRDYEEKRLSLKKLGWKRIAKNTQRFGWIIEDAVEHTETTETTTFEAKAYGDTIYINPRTNKTSWTRVWLSFYRSTAVRGKVRVLEIFYNVIFLIRRILAFFLPIAGVASLIIAFTGWADFFLKYGVWLAVAFFVWIACIIAEGIIARCAEAKLKNPSRQANVQKSQPKTPKPSNSRLNDVPDDDDDVITLKGQNGEDIDFVEIAGINYRGNFYSILQPVELLDGMEDNEALVFKVTRGSDGEDKFEVELNDEIIDAVFAEYNRLLDEAKNKGY